MHRAEENVRQTYCTEIFAFEGIGELCFSPFGVLFRNAGVPSIHKVKFYRNCVPLSLRSEFVGECSKGLAPEEDTCR
jgi:hypothetical protein